MLRLDLRHLDGRDVGPGIGEWQVRHGLPVSLHGAEGQGVRRFQALQYQADGGAAEERVRRPQDVSIEGHKVSFNFIYDRGGAHLNFWTCYCRVFVTATMADRSPPDLYLFRNYPSPQSQLGIANYDHPGMLEIDAP